MGNPTGNSDRLPRSPTKVGALIIGVQKAGTTALWSYLSDHPRVCTAERKELHFFDRPDWTTLDDTSPYDQHFTHCREGMKLEATPIYIYWRPCIERIHAYNPRMRLVAVLRHPVERAVSHWAMEFERGNEERDLESAIAAELAESDHGERPQDRVRSYVDRGHYWSQVERVRWYFPDSQLLLLRNEDLRHHHRATLQVVTDFLSLPPYRSFPEVGGVLRTPPTVPTLDQGLREQLVTRYLADIRSLEQYTGWDLDSWKR